MTISLSGSAAMKRTGAIAGTAAAKLKSLWRICMVCEGYYWRGLLYNIRSVSSLGLRR